MKPSTVMMVYNRSLMFAKYASSAGGGVGSVESHRNAVDLTSIARQGAVDVPLACRTRQVARRQSERAMRVLERVHEGCGGRSDEGLARASEGAVKARSRAVRGFLEAARTG